MVKGIFDELTKPKPKNHFTVGINDDVTYTSLDYDPGFSIESPKVVRALFYGLGADGTVGANKNTIKIIGEDTANYAQGYFVYDSKKSGAITVSHLRFGPTDPPALSDHLGQLHRLHQTIFLERYDVLAQAAPGAVFLLNTYVSTDEVWDSLPRVYQEHMIHKKMKFYVIDAYERGRQDRHGRAHQHHHADLLLRHLRRPAARRSHRCHQASDQEDLRQAGRKGRGAELRSGRPDAGTSLHEVPVPTNVTSTLELPSMVPAQAPEFVQKVTAEIMAGRGDDLPVSHATDRRHLPDRDDPVGEAQHRAGNPDLGPGRLHPVRQVCAGLPARRDPHQGLPGRGPGRRAASSFRSMPYKGKEYPGWLYTIQVAPEDCTGCAACVDVCPAKNKREPRFKAINMEPQPPLRDRERENYDFFLSIPEIDRRNVNTRQVKSNQLLQPLFEFSGACAGCGETPYVKLISQLFGDRTIVANATGCSSIYGGNLPTTPYAVNSDGRGPAWSNTLFEDNAEFGLGFRLTFDKRLEYAHRAAEKQRGTDRPRTGGRDPDRRPVG